VQVEDEAVICSEGGGNGTGCVEGTLRAAKTRNRRAIEKTILFDVGLIVD